MFDGTVISMLGAIRLSSGSAKGFSWPWSYSACSGPIRGQSRAGTSQSAWLITELEYLLGGKTGAEGMGCAAGEIGSEI